MDPLAILAAVLATLIAAALIALARHGYKSFQARNEQKEGATASPEPETASPEPETASPEPETASPEPETASPEPETASPEPETASPEPEYPIRFTCRETTEFHPSFGYHEGLEFEVFNRSEQPVRIKGFGLDLEMFTHDEWHDYHQAAHHPPYKFPVWLQPNDALEGVIDTEALVDHLHSEGIEKYFQSWTPYVDVAGYDRATTEIEKQSK